MVFKRYAGSLALAAALVFVPAAAAAPRAAVPQRIVSLSPTATEDLFAIGAGRQVVAVDNQSTYPRNAPKTGLSGYTPNAEAIAGYRPDLVVISNDLGGIVAALHKLHIHVLLQAAPENLDGAFAEMEQLGRVTGHAGQAKALVGRLRERVRSIRASLPKAARGMTVYHELEPDYYSVTSKTFIGRIYTLLGLRDIADAADKSGSGYPKLSAEYIVAANPDLIVLADTVCCGQTAAKIEHRPGWQTISAVRHRDIVPVDDSVASRWGPRIVGFMQDVAARLRIAARR